MTGPAVLVMEHVSPATRLLEKRRQMFEVQEALEAQKAECARKEEVFKKREEGLRKKDLELQESLIRFSKFLQENDSKRTRAEKKAADEIKTRIAKEAEIERLSAQLEELLREKASTSSIVEKNMRYHKYLETTLDVADEYHEINDLLMRHATLEATNNDLKAHAKACAEKNEAMRADLQVYTKAKTNEILNLNNEISQLKKDLEARERDTVRLQSQMDTTLQTASAKTLEHGQVCMATDNLFSRVVQVSHVSHPSFTSPLDQLGVIGDFMTDLAFIMRLHRTNQKEATKKEAATRDGGVPHDGKQQQQQQPQGDGGTGAAARGDDKKGLPISKKGVASGNSFTSRGSS